MEGLGISGGDDAYGFNHKDHCTIWSASAMHNALGHNKPFLWLKINCSVFEVNDKVPLENKEEFVVVVVLVPVILPLRRSRSAKTRSVCLSLPAQRPLPPEAATRAPRLVSQSRSRRS